jgi:hypothetical protein
MKEYKEFGVKPFEFKAKNYSKFQKGSGVYNCVVCGKKTRDTGNDEAGVQMCKKCYEENLEYNARSDKL